MVGIARPTSSPVRELCTSARSILTMDPALVGELLLTMALLTMDLALVGELRLAEGSGLEGRHVLVLGAPHGAGGERCALERLVQVVEALAAHLVRAGVGVGVGLGVGVRVRVGVQGYS